MIVQFTAMTDLIYLMNELVDQNGKILVDGIYNSVAPLTENEKKLYTNIDFDTDGYRYDTIFLHHFAVLPYCISKMVVPFSGRFLDFKHLQR